MIRASVGNARTHAAGTSINVLANLTTTVQPASAVYLMETLATDHPDMHVTPLNQPSLKPKPETMTPEP